ncbi:MAG: oligosaccharide flippase family protein [Elusimicrobia bacterium]|nr:oligosaccharide flippase family protein [Elusimicrobiota bacterium]
MKERLGASIASGAVYTYASLVLMKVILLINSVVIARWLGPENLGMYSIFSQALNFLLAFGLLGLPLAAGRFVAEYHGSDLGKLRETLSSALIFCLAVSGLLGIGLFTFANKVALGIYGEPGLRPLFRIGAVTIVFSLLSSLLRSVLQGLREIELLARLNVALGIAGAALTLVLVMGFTLKGVAIRDLSVAFLGSAAMFFAMSKALSASGISPGPVFSVAAMRRLFSLAGPLFLGSVMIFGVDLFIRSHLALKCGFSSAGFFSISDNFFQMVYFIPQAIAMPLLPIITRIYSAEPQNFPRHAARVIKVTGAIALPAAVALALAAGPAVRLLYGEAYAASMSVVFLVVFSAAVVSPAYIVGQLLTGAGLGMPILLLSALQACVNAAAGYLLINAYGLDGLGMAVVVSAFFNYSLSGTFVIKRLGLKRSEMRFGTYQLSVIMAGAAAYATTRFLAGPLFAVSSFALPAAMAAAQYLSLSEDEKGLLRETAGKVFARR